MCVDGGHSRYCIDVRMYIARDDTAPIVEEMTHSCGSGRNAMMAGGGGGTKGQHEAGVCSEWLEALRGQLAVQSYDNENRLTKALPHGYNDYTIPHPFGPKS